MRLVHISITPDFKVGDPCPDGYVDRHEWFEVHMKAGLKQKIAVSAADIIFRTSYPKKHTRTAQKSVTGHSLKLITSSAWSASRKE